MTTPNQVATDLATAEAETERLRAKQETIATAEAQGLHATELRLYRTAAHDLAIEANKTRNAAKQHLDDLATAEQLDTTALLAAFIELKNADAWCAAVALHAGHLDRVDPLPANAIGAPRTRQSRTQAIYTDLTWSPTSTTRSNTAPTSPSSSTSRHTPSRHPNRDREGSRQSTQRRSPPRRTAGRGMTARLQAFPGDVLEVPLHGLTSLVFEPY